METIRSEYLRDTILSKARALFASGGIKYISFDVFDTLVTRSLAAPKDLFYLMSPVVFEKCKIHNFHQHRTLAQKIARETSPREEITLGEIYHALQPLLHLSDTELSQLQELEIAFELQFCSARGIGKELWEAARATGKQLIFISDMYLPKTVISTMLESAGYTEPFVGFASCEHYRTKHSGSLFSHVVEELGCAPEEILHIGDNSEADVGMAHKAGLSALHLPAAMEHMQSHQSYAPLVGKTSTGGHSLLKGLLAERLFEAQQADDPESLFCGKVENIGYACVGPIVMGFALWLVRQAKACGITHLYFLAREGWILKQAYDAAAQHIPNAPQSVYLICSRRSLSSSFIYDAEDIPKYLRSRSFQEGLPIAQRMETLFGVLPDQASHPAWFGTEHQNTAAFIDACIQMQHPILAKMQKEREANIAYLNEQAGFKNGKIGLVDTSSRGTIQYALEKLSHRQFTGFYVYTRDAFAQYGTGPAQCYIDEFLDIDTHPPASLQNIPLLESLLSHTTPSVRYMEHKGGKSSPVFFESSRQEEHRKAFMEKLHTGALEFISNYTEKCRATLSQACINHDAAFSTFEAFTTIQPPKDLELLGGVCTDDIGIALPSIPLTASTKGAAPHLHNTVQHGKALSLGIFSAKGASTHLQLPEHDPSFQLGKKYPIPLLLPHKVTTIHEYRELITSLHHSLAIQRNAVEGEAQKLGKNAQPENSLTLLQQLERAIHDGHTRYIQKQASRLAGKDVYFWGCGAVYEQNKHYFASTKPLGILVNTVSTATATNKVDGIPVIHPLKHRLRPTTPIIIFCRLPYLQTILQSLYEYYPDFEQTDAVISCVNLEQE